MIRLVKLVDRFIGTPLCLVLAPLKLLKLRRKEPKKILAIMFWGIGSNINSLPAVSALKKSYPKAHITILAPQKNKEIFFGLRFVDKVDLLGLNFFSLLWYLLRNFQKFDIAVDMEHYLNISAIIAFICSKRVIGFKNRIRRVLYDKSIPFDPGSHSVHNNLNLAKLAGASGGAEKLEPLHYSDDDRKAVDIFLKESKIKKTNLLVGICAGSGPTMIERRWMPDRFAALADRIVVKYHAKVVFVGAPDESAIAGNIQGMMKNRKSSINSCGRVNLRQLIALTDRCSLFISNDTGPMHIAAAQGVKTIGLFGPETPSIFGPFGRNAVAVYKGSSCSPCIRIYEGRHVKCNNAVCMKAISVDDVWKKVEMLLKKR